jgi:hypothetical protein
MSEILQEKRQSAITEAQFYKMFQENVVAYREITKHNQQVNINIHTLKSQRDILISGIKKLAELCEVEPFYDVIRLNYVNSKITHFEQQKKEQVVPHPIIDANWSKYIFTLLPGEIKRCWIEYSKKVISSYV